MKINNELINKIYNNDPKKRIQLKNKEDKIKLSKYNEFIPMFDIYSEKIYPIRKDNIYYRLLFCHYRFINNEVKKWIENKYKKDKEKYKYNIDIISNYDIETLLKTSYQTLYDSSPELGLSISICKRNSFNKFATHLIPYYSKNELIKLGLNMGVIKSTKNIDINDQETHYKICKKISKNDISSKEIISHNKYIIDNNLISIICNYSLLSSYFMNQYLRNKENKNNFLINSINKLSEKLLNTPPLKNDYYLYRFINDDYFLKNIKKGDIFTDKGFISTTRDPFYSPGLKSTFGLILVKIKIPKNKNVGLLIENFSLFPKEEEFLLPPSSKFKLISKDEKFKYHHTNSEFEDYINKKYEFEYVGNNFNSIDDFKNNNFRSLENIDIDGNSKIDFINSFINQLEQNKYQINIRHQDKDFIIYYHWFNGSDIYNKFYYNENTNGIAFTIYDENFFPYLNIEFGDSMVVNYLNKFFYYDKKEKLDEIDIDLILRLADLFKYQEIILYLEFNNFSKFTNEEAETYLYNNLYCESLYQFLKNGEKFYPTLNKYEQFINFKFGYWKLEKLKKLKIPEEIKERYKSIIKNYDTISDLIIDIIENHFYIYDNLKEQFKILKELNPFDDLFLNIDVPSYFKNKKSIVNIPYDEKEKSNDTNFNLVFNQPIRRII